MVKYFELENLRAEFLKNRILILYNFKLNNLRILLDYEEITRAMVRYHPTHTHARVLLIPCAGERRDMLLPCPVGEVFALVRH